MRRSTALYALCPGAWVATIKKSRSYFEKTSALSGLLGNCCKVHFSARLQLVPFPLGLSLHGFTFPTTDVLVREVGIHEVLVR